MIGYDVAGPDDGPPIVFLHGTRLTRGMWAPQVARLSDTYRTIALDLPGHGTLAHRPFTLDAAADFVAHVIDEAAGGRAVRTDLAARGEGDAHRPPAPGCASSRPPA